MSDKHQLRTGVIIAVIASLISTFILWFLGFIPAVWQACKSASICLFRFLLSSIPVPVWLIVLLSPLIISTLIRMYAALRQKDTEHQNWLDYKQDEIMGMIWRWRYTSYQGEIENIWCFCPDDNTELVYEDGYSLRFPTVSFRCETCGRKFGPFDGDRHHVLGMAERQIRRKIRTDEWKAVVERLG